MQFWSFLDNFLGIFLTMAILGVILTHSGEFTSIVQQTGQTFRSLFNAMSLQS